MRGELRRLSLLMTVVGTVVVLSSCNSLGVPFWESGRVTPQRDTARPSAAPERDTATLPVRTTAELREAGPTYVAYDDGPVLRRSDRLTGLLEVHLLPVIEERDLPLRTSTLFWVLVTAQGDVAEVELHTSSSVEAFDRAATEVARRLEYEPARRNGRPLPVWILSRVHLRMP